MTFRSLQSIPRRGDFILLLTLLLCLVGCRTAPARRTASAETGQFTLRNNSYSMLNDLLDQQKHVGLLLLIKREESDVRKLVRRIAAASSDGASLLKRFAREDPNLSLDDTWLPPGEAQTREAIAQTTRERLLHESGTNFELTLLLTQIQAVNYAAHLAQVAGEADTDAGRAQAMVKMRREFEGLYLELFRLIQSRSDTPAQ